MTVSKQLIQNIKDLKKSLNEISVYDLDVYTSMELYYNIAKKLNEVINELSRFEGIVSEEVIKQNEKLTYLLGEGLTNKVIERVNDLIQYGTIYNLINNKLLVDINNKIDVNKQDVEEKLKLKANQKDLEVVESKVDLLSRVENGQTEGNGELLDIRIDNEGFEHSSSGNAVRSQINKITDVLEKLPNLINHNKTKVGFMETTGVISDLQDYKYTELIKVDEGKTIYFGSTNSNYAYVKRVTAYTNPTTVDQAKGGQDLMSWTVPAGVKYAVFTFMPSKYNNLTAKYDSIGDVNNYEYGYVLNYDKLNDKGKTIIENSKETTDKISISYNLFNDNVGITKGKALKNTGELYDAVTHFATDFIEGVKEETTYTMEHIRYLLCFDEKGSILSEVVSSNDSKITFKTPKKCSKIRFNTGISYLDTYVSLYEGSEIKQNNLPIVQIKNENIVFEKELKNTLSTKWKGVKWCSYGDSITGYENTNNWQNITTNYFEMGSHFNRGVGGSEIAYWEGMTFDYEGKIIPRGMCMWDRIKTIPQDVKLIFFMGGTNDVFRYDGTPKGDLVFNKSDKNDLSWYDYCTTNGLRTGDFNIKTFKGAVASTIMKLQTWCPNALIIVGTQLSGRVKVKNNGETEYPKNNLGLSPIDYVEFTKESAQFMSTPIIDVFGQTGINLFNRDKYLSDEVHPYTNEGQKLLARVVINGLKQQEIL